MMLPAAQEVFANYAEDRFTFSAIGYGGLFPNLEMSVFGYVINFCTGERLLPVTVSLGLFIKLATEVPQFMKAAFVHSHNEDADEDPDPTVSFKGKFVKNNFDELQWKWEK